MRNGHQLDASPDSSLAVLDHHSSKPFHRMLLYFEVTEETEETSGEPETTPEQTSTEQIEETYTTSDGNASLILPQSTCACVSMPICHCRNSRRRLLLGLDLDNSQCGVCPPGQNCEVGTCQLTAPVWTTLLKSTAEETTAEPKTTEETTEEPFSEPTQPFTTPTQNQ